MKSLPRGKNFLGLERKHSAYSTASIALLSAPYEHSVSYGGGTGRGPAAILKASHFVEFWDEEFKRELCFEHGIAAMPPLVFGTARDARARAIIEAAVAEALADGKFVVTLGGEHSISIAPIHAHVLRHPNLSVLHFDAHSDLRAHYLGNPFSHASALARVMDFLPGHQLVQVGIRAQCIEEYRTIQERGIRTFFASDLHAGLHGKLWQRKVLDALGDEVYITFDVDYFDPSIMPATGTPEPGGFLWDETMALLKFVGAKKRILGFDVVELAPMRALPFPAFLAAKLVYKMMNAAFMRR